jgi:predicted CopG family antitoxin
MSKVKLIAVSPKNYESLRKFGDFQDSFDDVITKILNKIDTMPNESRGVKNE